MIVIVKSGENCFLESLIESKRLLEEARGWAANANERVFEIILNSDDEDKIAEVEEEARIAWAKYDRCIIRYCYDLEQARKKGLIQ